MNMASTGARAVNVVRTHRFDLPLVLLKKLLAPWLVTETIILYRCELGPETASGATGEAVRDMPDDPAGHGRGKTAVASISLCWPDSAHSDIFKLLSRSFPGNDFAVRLARAGTECLVALHGSSVAGYAWVSRVPLYIAEINHVYPVAADELFIYDSFVHTEFRGRGIHTAMIGAILQENRKGGQARRAYIAASVLNRASIRGVIKAGFTECGRIRYVKWRGRERWWGLNV